MDLDVGHQPGRDEEASNVISGLRPAKRVEAVVAQLDLARGELRKDDRSLASLQPEENRARLVDARERVQQRFQLGSRTGPQVEGVEEPFVQHAPRAGS